MDPARHIVAWTSRPGLVALSVATAAFVVYLATMCRTYGPIDKGELAAVATTLGIAHPTGYPTLTLLGHFVTRLSPLRPVLSLNVLAACLTAAGVGLMALVLAELLRLAGGRTRQQQGRDMRKEGRRGSAFLPDPDRLWLAGLAALFAGFTTTWWSQATGFEVYALHALLLPLATWLFLRYLEAHGPADGSATHWRGTAFSFTLGLAFTNHMSAIMLAPAFLFLYFRVAGWSASAFRSLLVLIPGFLVGLLPYVYLPVRAWMGPRLNWGDPSTWDSFVAHVAGEQFHFALFYAPRVFGQQTAYFFHTLVADTGYAGLVVVVLGAVHLARHGGFLAIWTGLLFLSCMGLAGLYDINDIGNYHLTAVLAIAVAAAFGLAALHSWLGSKTALAVALLTAGLNGVLHFHAMDESQNFLVEDLTRNVLKGLPRNAVIFSGDWDYWTSGSLYAQEVDGLRRDVLVLDPESLRSQWYLDGLSKCAADLMTSVVAEAKAFRGHIRRFEREKPAFGPSEGDAYFEAYFAMINAMIERNAGQRPFFVTEHVDLRIGKGWLRVPFGLAYRLTKDGAYQAEPFPRHTFRPWTGRVDPYAVKICELYTMSALARARYEESHGHPALASEYGHRALSFDPRFSEADVPDFPLHIDDQIRETLRNYRQLRERAEAVAK